MQGGGGGGSVFHLQGFCLITSDVDSFSTRNFEIPLTLNVELGQLGQNKKFRNLLLGQREMTIFGERAS